MTLHGVDLKQGKAKQVLKAMPAESVQTCVTSPPYWGLRDYGVDGQLGLEPTPDAYVDRLVGIFEEVRRVLKDDGTLWLNLGDSYANKGGSGPQGETGDRSNRTYTAAEAIEKMGGQLKPKDLVGIPWRVAFALQEAGWWLRNDIIWHKPNPMPESVTDRCTTSHEHIFLFAKSKRYYFDNEAIKTEATGLPPGNNRPTKAGRAFRNGDENHRTSENLHEIGARSKKNKRDVWKVSTKPYSDAHFAVYPPDLIEPCILAGAPKGGTVLDPFCGSGTTGAVAVELVREFVGIELNDDYLEMAQDRIREAKERSGTLTADEANDGGGQIGIFSEAQT